MRYEPENKTIRGIVLPEIEYIAEYSGILTRREAELASLNTSTASKTRAENTQS